MHEKCVDSGERGDGGALHGETKGQLGSALEAQAKTHPKRVRSTESDNLLIVEPHAVENISKMIGGLSSIWEEASRRALRRGRGSAPMWRRG